MMKLIVLVSFVALLAFSLSAGGDNHAAAKEHEIKYLAGGTKTFECPNNNCGSSITTISYKSGPQQPSGDLEAGLAMCAKANKRPIGVFQATSVRGGKHGTRYNVALCMEY